MRVLYICGTYCPSHGGAEISMHTLLKGIRDNFGVDVRVLTDVRYTGGKEKWKYDGIDLFGTDHNNRESSIQKIIDNFHPNIIMTQLMWSDVALRMAKKNKIASVFRACKIPFELDLRVESDYSPVAIISVSEAVSVYIKEKFDRECTIMHPAIDVGRYLVARDDYTEIYSRPFITLFNPLKRKGGGVFREMAKALPGRKFASVHGWTCLKKSAESEEFSEELIKRICESLGTSYTGQKPEYVDFREIKNISLLDPTENVGEIYSKTRILVVPSQWEEAFGRVVVEAMANGIPVVGSNVGGLKEAMGSGGILVNDYTNPSAWVEEIKRLDDREYYHEVSQRGLREIKDNYSFKKIIKDAYEFLNNI